MSKSLGKLTIMTGTDYFYLSFVISFLIGFLITCKPNQEKR